MNYKLSKRTNGVSGADYYSITVPKDIAELIPDDTKFRVELTDDGILYKPVKTELPSWVIVPAVSHKRVSNE